MLVLVGSVGPHSLQPHRLQPPGSSVNGILQARILEYIAIPFSRGSSRPTVPTLHADSLLSEPPGKQRTLCQDLVQNTLMFFMYNCNKTGNLVFYPKLYLEIGTYIAKFGLLLVAQMVKNLPAKRETGVRSLGWEAPLEEGIATHSSILAWRIPMDRGARQVTVHEVAKSWT